MDKETIRDSAIHIINCSPVLNVIEGTVTVSNIRHGIVIRALRHLICFNNIKKAGYAVKKKDIVCGFIAQDIKRVTRFVDRAEAGKIAFQAGQIEQNLPLISEAIFPPTNKNDVLGYNMNELLPATL